MLQNFTFNVLDQSGNKVLFSLQGRLVFFFSLVSENVIMIVYRPLKNLWVMHWISFIFVGIKTIRNIAHNPISLSNPLLHDLCEKGRKPILDAGTVFVY